MQITRSDGSSQLLDELSNDQLDLLHWEEEREFARRIAAAPKGAETRAKAFQQGYDTVTTIIGKRYGESSSGLVMGLNPRYVRLVLKLLKNYEYSGKLGERSLTQPKLFEVGYGSGAVLEEVAKAGFGVSGIEVSTRMREQALKRLPEHTHNGIHLGDFLSLELGVETGTFQVAYWNDVFEHIPPDENLDYLSKLYGLLAPGGVLLTITPNWHMRPGDITGLYKPPRTEAEGFHLREYTLREMVLLLRRAGFAKISTPLFVTRKSTALLGGGLTGIKRLFEPVLEHLPYGLAQLFCRGFALSCTLAVKPG
ncbi:MAG: class I SAM-dependent methyltransferase [Pirellulales bacterium]|nr:class I SAM-dependent methyltransferase [Pirellulales bacterium]